MPEGGAGARSAGLYARALERIPGGVNSPVRAFGAVGGEPFFVSTGEGAYLVDADGRRLVDWVQSWGATILGHAHPAVVEAVSRAAARGTTFGAPTEAEVLLAERICSAVAGCEMVRLVSSGTEAAMTAIRVARAATGRDRIVKFAGCYHGHSDALLAAGGSGVATLGLAGSAGVPAAAVADTLVAPYNVVPELDSAVACVVVEPVAANMGLVPPAEGFLEGLRTACDAVGALLVFDEVITGFRLAAGGASGSYGITPDLWCFGKVIGGGLPVGAFGGSADLMATLAPLGPVYQAGTLSGNPLATASGAAVLEHVTPANYDELSERVDSFALALCAALEDGGLAAAVPTVGPLVGLYVGAPGSEIAVPTNYEEASAIAENGIYRRLFHALLRRGVALAPGGYEILFPGFGHGERELARVVEVARAAAGEVTAALAAG
jgi:glutamate-1-semialdehyde 2,1-aminomutase